MKYLIKDAEKYVGMVFKTLAKLVMILIQFQTMAALLVNLRLAGTVLLFVLYATIQSSSLQMNNVMIQILFQGMDALRIAKLNLAGTVLEAHLNVRFVEILRLIVLTNNAMMGTE